MDERRPDFASAARAGIGRAGTKKPYPSRVSSPEQIWLPLVDEPIGEIVRQIEQEHEDIRSLVHSPDRLLAFRTFAYIRVGLVLGQLLLDNDIAPYDGTETWVERLLRDAAHRRRIVEEVRGVAEEIAADARYGEHQAIGPDDAARARFREFARRSLTDRSG